MRFEEMKMNEAMEVNGGMIGPISPVSPVIPIIVGKVVSWLLNR